MSNVADLHTNLINEALYQERMAAEAARAGNVKMQVIHEKAAAIVRERAALLQTWVQS